MFSFFVFILAGVALVVLAFAKRLEMRRANGKTFILRAVSLGDERVRDLYHRSLHFYSEGKVKVVFFVKKQLPVRIKIYTSRGLAKVQELIEERFGDIRNSRFIDRREGINEFFKTIAEIEKGAGQINETFHEETESEASPQPELVFVEDISEATVSVMPQPEPEAAPAAVNQSTETPVDSPRPKKPRAPQKKRLAPAAVPDMAAEAPVPVPVAVEVPPPATPTTSKARRKAPTKPRAPRSRKLPVVEISEY